MEINKELKNEIWEYCRLNDIMNIDDFIIRLIKQGFTAEKFGSSPMVPVKEKIVEKIVEIEKIVEKIVEVPVEKKVYITDDSMSGELTDKIKTLESERDYYKKEMEDFQLKCNSAEEKLELEEKNKKKNIYGE